MAEIAELEAFITVVRLESFSGAARELGRTQSTVSRQVQRLEQEYGERLMNRSPAGFGLTPAGQRVLSYATDAVERDLRLRRELKQAASKSLTGQLRIVAGTTSGDFLLPPLLAAFTQLHPGVGPDALTVATTAVSVELLERRRDIGFTGLRGPSRALQYERITDDEVVLAVPVDHSFANRGEIEIDELEGEIFVSRESSSGTSRTVRSSLAKVNRKMPPHHVAMTLSTSSAIIQTVSGGLGVGWVSSRFLARLTNPGVSAVRICGLDIRRTIYLVSESRRVLPEVAVVFADWVRSQAEQGLLDEGKL